MVEYNTNINTVLAFILLCSVLYFAESESGTKKRTAPALVVTVATDSKNDGLRRLRDSAEEFGLKLAVFGENEEWNGGDMRHNTGGAQKIRILREGLKSYRDRDDLLVVFVDAYDVIINADADTIVQRFVENFEKTRIVFGAEPFCWPNKSLSSKYPLVTFGERFLNSGMFLGYAADVFAMLELGKDLKDNDDDQLFYTNIFIDSATREKFGIALDSLSRIFQNLNGMGENVAIEFSELDGDAEVFNKLYNTHPVVIHGNGPSKTYLNSFGNYIAHHYNRNEGCIYCEKLKKEAKKNVMVGIAIYITKPIPYIEEFFEHVKGLDFSKERIHLLVYNNQDYSNKLVESYVKDFGRYYASVEILDLKLSVGEHSARDFSLKWAASKSVDYLLMLDADVHLTNPKSLQDLVDISSSSKNGLLSPMVVQPGKLYSNFWGAISESGFYSRSADYIPIAERERQGIWNVPFVSSALLISSDKFHQKGFLSAFSHNLALDADMSFAQYCRDNTHFMFVVNLEEYGLLVESEHFSNLPDGIINRELYDFPSNKFLWEKRYIHNEYFDIIKPETEVDLACPDVYDFPFVSERFCKEIIEIMENFGQWSDGSNMDKRLEGGYENVPTRDIHMNQVGLEAQWLSIIDNYVAPLQEKVFIGYYQRPIKSSMMFVVRYKPDEQPFLRPHHDASTYSIDIALNRRGVDYEGGGVRYIRYNCTVPADQIGWSMLFPGRLTHMHEGLPTTKGTRYILVSFVNP